MLKISLIADHTDISSAMRYDRCIRESEYLGLNVFVLYDHYHLPCGKNQANQKENECMHIPCPPVRYSTLTIILSPGIMRCRRSGVHRVKNVDLDLPAERVSHSRRSQILVSRVKRERICDIFQVNHLFVVMTEVYLSREVFVSDCPEWLSLSPDSLRSHRASRIKFGGMYLIPAEHHSPHSPQSTS